MEVSPATVKELRERTGAGVMDCRQALTEAEGSVEKAVDILRRKGLAQAAKKAGRVTAEGMVDSYIHMGGKIGVLVEVNCETDFVAKTQEFRTLVRDIAMQIAAAKPSYIIKEEVPDDVKAKEREIYRAQAVAEGKPERVLDTIVEGRLGKFYKDNCLMEQPFIKEQNISVRDLVMQAIARMGENITVRRFARFQLGEGIEKKREDLAEAVRAEHEAVCKG